jgi:hypothetical protein
MGGENEEDQNRAVCDFTWSALALVAIISVMTLRGAAASLASQPGGRLRDARFSGSINGGLSD